MNRAALTALPLLALKHYTAATSSAGLRGGARLQLSKEATTADVVAVFVASDNSIIAGTITANFSPSDPTTWPGYSSTTGASCRFVALLVGGQVSQVPEGSWGRYYVALRVGGATANVSLLASGDGEGMCKEEVLAAPTTVGDFAAIDISILSGGPVSVSLDKTALTTDTCAVYVTDDQTIDTGTGAPPASQYVGQVAGGAPLLIVAGSLATRLVVRRLHGTVARNMRISGAIGYPSTAALPAAPRTPGAEGKWRDCDAQNGQPSTAIGGTGGAGGRASLIGGAGGNNTTAGGTGGAGGMAFVQGGTGGTGGAGGAPGRVGDVYISGSVIELDATAGVHLPRLADATVTAPSAGYVSLYFSTTGNALAFKDSGGTVHKLTEMQP